MPRPTARGVAFTIAGVALIVLAYVLERPELLVLGIVPLAVVVLAVLSLAFSRPQVQVDRELEPLVAVEGERVRVTVTLRGRSGPAEWVETVPAAPGFIGPGRIGGVRAASPVELHYHYEPEQRGVVGIGPLLLEHLDPFRLVVRLSSTRVASPQLVIPAATPLDRGPIPLPHTRTGAKSSRSRERADDDVITREYRRGDAVRRVHWRQTARHGELMVRQDEPQAGPRAVVLLDTSASGLLGSPRARSGAATDPFERAVRVAASVAVHLDELGYAVELRTSTEQAPDAPLALGAVGDVLGALAVVAPGSPPSIESRPQRHDGPVVAIACAPDDWSIGWMLAQRSPSAPAAALLVGSASGMDELLGTREGDAPLEALERAGWNAVRISVSTPIDQAWLALVVADAIDPFADLLRRAADHA